MIHTQRRYEQAVHFVYVDGHFAGIVSRNRKIMHKSVTAWQYRTECVEIPTNVCFSRREAIARLVAGKERKAA